MASSIIRPKLSSLYFACSYNSTRSPMAAALARQIIAKHYDVSGLDVDSVGVHPSPINPFVVEVMLEIGINLRNHIPKSFVDLGAYPIDLVVALTHEAEHEAHIHQKNYGGQVLFWNTPLPPYFDGARERVLDGYRTLRNNLSEKIDSTLMPLL